MKRKSTYEIIVNTYNDFAENTSLHGLKYTSYSNTRSIEKMFWAIITILALCGAGFMTIIFWQRYISNPTRTIIETSTAPTSIVPFPSVTICNSNRIVAHKLEAFLETLILHGENRDMLRRGFYQLHDITNALHEFNLTELDGVQRVLNNNAMPEMYFALKKISHSCEDLLKICQWNSEVVDCMTIFEEFLTIHGICCAFNHKSINKSRPIHNLHSGYSSGLSLVLHPSITTNESASDVRVVFHKFHDFPGFYSVDKIVSPGMETHIQVSSSKVKCSEGFIDLPVLQRECLFKWERPLKYHALYSEYNCIAENFESFIFKKCGCVPFYYVFSDNPRCNFTKIPCIAFTRDIVMNHVRSLPCPSLCEDIMYNLQSDIISLRFQNNLSIHSLLPADKFPNDTIVMYVYLVGLQSILLQDMITSPIYLLASFGGIYSLFIGCSFLTMFEIIYYCFMRFPINLGLLGRVGPRRNFKELVLRPHIHQKLVLEDINGYLE